MKNLTFYLSLISFIVLVFAYPVFIKYLKKKQLGQYIRQEGPDLHNYKQGTPTMGGILFISAIFLLSILTYFINQEKVFLVVGISSILFGLVGFIDDYSSIRKKDSTGLTALQKLLFQFIVSFFVVLIILRLNPHSSLKLPFVDFELNFGFFYPIWGIIYLSGMSNATNLTDGIDGLSGGIYISSVLFTAIVAGIEIQNLGVLILPVIAYLLFNIKPAKIFMGDTGSLALGGILGALAIYYSIEIFTVFTCFIFILEMFSVIIQVTSFKIRHKKVFLMSPIHHHFELKKWSEERIVLTFWTINFLTGIIALGGVL
ncbi:phospho-N-acetylmuramoyl-pentapeptide-transferase [Petrotoga sp. 9PW.55.5.1]|uniref:phospho-N-acetylmuramoyl-pentapeptide- transferase n=1 Tax=Petrotoga sp. 9PW.55.5.1 TaxID=1308979 RepID=UPI000DC5BFF3|nr:phospho-N-acetylmuramoyl-pentapeptide-transferase [Petrotoga sp. 9PW.55.5.1]RAO98482.1 phospho-N-acetylmuramoyl-pentapeptide-transferase [Petrotoga sp. 9PW.55.5.1]